MSSKPRAAWTLLLYIVADDEAALIEAAQAAIAGIAGAPSSEAIDVVAQVKLDGSGVTRYLLRGSAHVLERLPGSVDMGAHETLTAFIDWGARRFPADRLALVVSSHADGGDDEPPPGQRRRVRIRKYKIALDGDDYLTNRAFRDAIANSGHDLDLLGCDACLMSMFEVGYEVRSVAKVLVASQDNAPTAGWPYPAILSSLVERPDMDAHALGETCVRRFGAWYERHPSDVTWAYLSAMDLKKMEVVASAVDELAHALLPHVEPDYPRFDEAYGLTDPMSDPAYSDLEELTQLLSGAFAGDTAVEAAARRLLVARDQACFANHASGSRAARAHGMTLFAPKFRVQAPLLSALPEYEAALTFPRAHPAWPNLLGRYQNTMLARSPLRARPA